MVNLLVGLFNEYSVDGRPAWEVLIASSRAEVETFRECFPGKKPDLFFLNINLYSHVDGEGLSLASQLRRVFPEVNLAFMSGGVTAQNLQDISGFDSPKAMARAVSVFPNDYIFFDLLLFVASRSSA